MKINSFDKEIHSLFESSFYIIPRFQRPYSWDKDNIEEFWQDTIVNNENEYFIGSIVVFKKKDKTYGVVDGQQRLTTLTIILSSLRNLYKKNGFEENAKGLHNLIERKDINNDSRYVLQTETSFPYFQEYIQKFSHPETDKEITNEEKSIQTAFRQINNLTDNAVNSINIDSTINDEAKRNRLQKKINEIRDKILNLKVIFIELDDEDDAYLIFETLNTRGKDLAPADLVKNLLSRYIKPSNKDVDLVKIKWQKIVDTVENAPGELSVNNFLQHHWLANFEYTSNKKLYKSIRQHIKKGNSKEYLSTLEKDSYIYRYINEPIFKDWRNEEIEIKNSLLALDIFHVRQPLPMILAIMSKYEKKELTIKQTSQILKAIESFIFKYTAIATTQSTGGLSMMYSSFARRITSSKTQDDKNKVLYEIKVRLREAAPSLEVFKISFGEVIYTKTKTKDRKLIKYILSKFHDDINAGHKIDYNQMTIEHILPLDKINKYKNSEDSIGCIGNLILLSAEINRKLANKEFSVKKKILEHNGYLMDDNIKKHDTWHKSEIIERLEAMAEKAYSDFWKI